MKVPFSEIVRRQLQESKTANNPWVGSKHELFKMLRSPQDKGKVGVLAYKNFLEGKGYVNVEVVASEGDITYKDPKTGLTYKDEVKTASASLEFRKRDQKYSVKHWFNQIRPNQEGWDRLTLIAVFPESHRIYRMSREDFLENRLIGNSGIGPGHTGTDELDEVTLIENTNQNTYSEWELIYEGV